MKGFKRIFMLATLMCMVFICAGCVKPTKLEHDIAMDKNEKGTYSVKYTFSKSTFENTVYGSYSSYDTYVKELETLVSKDVAMDLSVDSKTSKTEVYVTVEIDFNSVKDLNTKLNKVYKQSNQLYNANVKSEKEINEYKLLNNACANENLDTVLQEELKSNGIEFDVNSEQYKVLNYAFTTGEKVYSLADVEQAKTNATSYESQKFVNYSENSSDMNLVYMEKDAKGKKRMAVASKVCNVLYDYLYNVTVCNQNKVWTNAATYLSASQNNMNKAVIANKTAICKKYVKEIKKYVEASATQQSCNLANLTTKELMTKVYAIDTSFVSIYKSCLNDLIKVYISYSKTTEVIQETKFSATYGEIVCEDIIKESEGDTSYLYVDETKEVVEDVDDSPKTADAFNVEYVIILGALSMLATVMVVVIRKRRA